MTNLLKGDMPPPEPVVDKVIPAEVSSTDDKQIRQRLQEIYSQLEPLRTVDVAVDSGVVTLSGTVNSTTTADDAKQFARQVEGVVAVENQLQVDRDLDKRLGQTWSQVTAVAQGVWRSLPLVLLAVLFIVISWLTGRWVSRRRGLYRRFSPNRFIAELLGQITHILFVIVGVVLALVLLDATALIGTILGAAGIVGLAFGFAVRDTVENYISSILLSIRNPFAKNDFVEIDGHSGNVLRLTSRATVLLSPDGNHIRIPNATVFKAVITNFSRNPQRRFEFDIGIGTDHDLLQAQAYALDILKKVQGVLADPQPLVVVQALGDSNVLLRFFGWVDQRRHDFIKVRSEALRGVKEAFDRSGIAMPVPMYNLRVSRTGGGVRGELSGTAGRSPDAAGVVQVDSSQIQDLRADRAIERQIEREAAQADGLDLLDSSAPREV